MPTLLKMRLQKLSRKMRDLGGMQQAYKGLAAYSSMSSEIQRCTLMHFIKIFKTEISLIYLYPNDQKAVWYNKPLFLSSESAIMCIDDKYLYVEKKMNQDNQTVISIENVFADKYPMFSNELLNYINELSIFDDAKDIYYDTLAPSQTGHQSLLLSLKQGSPEHLRWQIGEAIYNDLQNNNKTPGVLAAEFDAYLEDSYEKTVYVLC